MVKLFRATETDFTHNEWVLSEIISCKVNDGINEDFTNELEYPLEDSKDLSKNLVIGAIVSAPSIDSRQNQLFRIISKETTNDSVIVQTQAKLLADLKENRVKAMTLTGLTRKQAIQTVLDAALEPHGYTVGNLDVNTNTDVIVNISEGSVLSAIIGEENSILSKYGGEFIVNNNTIDIIDSRGANNGVVIEYGKNLSSISEKIDNVDLATVLIPKSGEYRIPEYFIESPNVNKYEKRYFKDVEMNLDIWDGENEKGENQITVDEAYILMRKTCEKMFSIDKVDQMTFNYTINYIELSKTEEYKNFAELEAVNIGDSVTIRHKILNLDLQGRVNNITYTVDSEGNTTIDTVEIGFNRKNLTDIINIAVKNISFAKEEIKLQVKNDISKVNAQLKIQDGKINAVVEKDGTGMGWQLKQDAFVVACEGASGASVIIDKTGLTVEDGKFKLKNGGSTVFKVNTRGICQADGGFVVEDGDISCKIDSTGILLYGENGNKAKIEILDDGTYSGTYIRDDLYVEDVLRVFGKTRLEGSVSIKGETLDSYIEGIIDKYCDEKGWL